jgi:hypothetical protein
MPTSALADEIEVREFYNDYEGPKYAPILGNGLPAALHIMRVCICSGGKSSRVALAQNCRLV